VGQPRESLGAIVHFRQNMDGERERGKDSVGHLKTPESKGRRGRRVLTKRGSGPIGKNQKRRGYT